MKAWVLKDNGDIRFGEADLPVLNEGEVLVKVKAAGICGSDISRIYRNGAYFYPLIPGHEFSGQVIETGNGVDSGWCGKRVGVFPLIPCKECQPCKNQQYEMCRRYSYIGSRRHGSFAEYTAVPAENLLELPDSVTYEEAAMLEPMSVAVHAIRRISINPHDKVVICGLGTIGIFVLMFLKEMGIDNIYLVGSKKFQENTAVKLGIPAEHYCDSKHMDVSKWLNDKTNGSGADVYFECVGRNETICQAVDNTSAGGKIVLVGNPYSDIAMDKNIYWKILRNQITVTGTWNSSFTHNENDDWHYVLDKLSDKQISPENMITHRLLLSELEKGLHIMRDKTGDFIKVMLCL
ncbi:MAG: galactitol-1-phosphate 5-dehydrogenase [Porcipelethomonas sp.]